MPAPITREEFREAVLKALDSFYPIRAFGPDGGFVKLGILEEVDKPRSKSRPAHRNDDLSRRNT